MKRSRQSAVSSPQKRIGGRWYVACGLVPTFHLPPATCLFVLLVTCHLSLATAAFGGTHVTATYDLGANPHVMTTVAGTPEYGLVFAERNKPVTYNGIEYGPSEVKGYLNASGQLNDGAGNLWLDLIPNLGATPADSYYVVTFNIQGRVHAEIWVVPDVATVGAESVRQAQPPSTTSSGFDLTTATGLLGLAHGGTGQSSWTAARCVRVNNAGSGLESAAADCGTGGGSAPLASATVSGTVKTDTTVGDPVVYLKTSADTLLAGKASSVHTHSESDVTNLTTDLAGKEATANKNQANGYAGLTAASKLNIAQGQEVWGIADLTTYNGASGNGTTAIQATITAPSSNDVLTWSGSNWINQAPSGGSSHALLSATHSDTTPAAVSRGAIITGQGASPTKWASLAKGAQYCVVQAGALEIVCESVRLDQAAAVSNTLGASNGGSGSAYVAFAGPSSTAKTFTLPNFNATIEYQANKNAASGYPGLDASSKLTASQGQEVWGAADLTDYAGTSGTGSTALKTTITSPASNDCLIWNGTNWVNSTCPGGGGGGDNISVNGTAATDADFDDATPAAPANAINVKWQKDALSPNNLSAYVPYSSPLTVTSGNLTSSFTASSSDTLTNKTLDAEGTGNSVTIPSKVWLSAAGCNNATAAPFYDLPTSNAPAAACYGTSPHRFGGLDFADGAAALTSEVSFTLPGDWTGAIDLKSIWFCAAGTCSTNNFVMTLATVCVADAEALNNPSYNTAQTFTIAGSATQYNRISNSQTAITTTGCAAGETMFLKVGRDPTNGSDTQAGTMSLFGIEITARRAM